jgi:hypothetical protein
MIQWGPKIETGYSTNPQIFKRTNGEFNESQNMASSNAAVVDNLSTQLEKIRNRQYDEVTIIAGPGETIDLTQYFGVQEGATVSGDFIDGDATDLGNIIIRSDVSDGAHTGVVTMPDGTIYMFAVIINPGYNGAYHINYNGNPLFIGYNTTHDNSGSEGYKLISPDHYSTSAAGDEIFIIEPSGVGYTLTMQGKVLKEPKLSKWGHIMFSDNRSEAGIYLFEETSTAGVYKIRSSSDGINYVNVYKEHGVVGNDKAVKAGLATYTIEEVATYPLTLPAEGSAAICLPFNVVIPEGICAYDATTIDIKNNESGSYSCTMRAIAGPGETLKRGTPTIVNGSAGTHQFVITMSDQGGVTSLPESLLKGNYVESSLTQSGNTKKFLFANSVFKTFDGSKDIAANQCWLECSIAQVSEIAIHFSDPTGIEEIMNTPQSKGCKIYSIAGKKLSHPQKGINIVDSKKILVK